MVVCYVFVSFFEISVRLSETPGQVNLDGLPAGQPYAKETYGSDVTYYVATSEDDIPIRPTVPSAG